MESKTSPQAGQAIHSSEAIQTEELGGFHPRGNATAFLQGAGARLIWGFLDSTRETQGHILRHSDSKLFCPGSLVSWMQDANRGLKGNNKMEVRGNQMGIRKLLHFSEGQMAKIQAAGHFPPHCTIKFQCNHGKKMAFLSLTMPQSTVHIFNTWLTNISQVPASTSGLG